jgi:hypothetical protein
VKKLFCSDSVFPSYLGHILSAGGIFPDERYTQRYSRFFKDSDAAWLSQNSDLFRWGNGMAGPLFKYCLLVSGYVSPALENGMRRYYEALVSLGQSGDASELLLAFPELNGYQVNWGRLDHPQAIEMLSGYRSEILRFMDVLLENWTSFEKNVWPCEKESIQPVSDRMNLRLSSHGLIEKWESATGYDFLSDRYEFVLSSGMRKAPRFNSLGYDRNWVYYETPLLYEGIIHEIGTHLLRAVKQGVEGDFEYLQIYNSYETLCCVLTEKVFADLDLKGSILKGSRVFDPDSYEFFSRHINSLPVMNLPDLLQECLVEKKNKLS